MGCILTHYLLKKMATKKNNYISTELDWAEEQLVTWRAYIDNNPLHELKDRIEWKPTARGGTMPMVISSIEQQGKFVQDTMKNYLSLLEIVEKLREKEEAKFVSKGGANVPARMRNRKKKEDEDES
jgi:hypothetical protein